MKLVIVESPGQIRPLKTLPGADFLVRASFGHVPGLFALAFSAGLDAQLDRVARGERSRSQVLEAFCRGHLAPALKKATASGFYEGALSNRMLGPVGGLLLRQPPEPASPAPAAGGNRSSVAGSDPASKASNTNTAPSSPVAEIRFDASDLVGIRQAVAAAMTQAVLAAPPGGYASPNAALGAVRSALGGAASDPALGTYLERRDVSIGRRVMQDSQASHGQADADASLRGAADRGEQ